MRVLRQLYRRPKGEDHVPVIRPGALGLIVFFVVVGTGMTVGALALLPPGIADVIAGIPYGAAAGILAEEIRSREERRFYNATEKQLAGLANDNDRLQAENKRLQITADYQLSLIAERERRDTLLSKGEANTAYYLGEIASMLPTLEPPDGEPAENSILLVGPRMIPRWLSDLGLNVTKTEAAILRKPLKDRKDALRISELIYEKAQSLKMSLRCFFEFGNRVTWLQEQVKRAPTIRPVLHELELLRDNPYLSLDAQYSHVVRRLIQILEQYRAEVNDSERNAIIRSVREVLDNLPPFYWQGDTVGDYRTVETTPWMWTLDEAGGVVAIRVVDEYTIKVRDVNTYDVIKKSGAELEVVAQITHDTNGWHCSKDIKASEDHPCFELSLVLGGTDWGKPVTEALLVTLESGRPQADDVPMSIADLGFLLKQQGDVEGARRAFQQAIDSGHTHQAPRAAAQLGVLLAEQGDVEGARRAFQQAIDSGHAEAAGVAAANLGGLLAEQGDVEGARWAFQQAIDSGHAEAAAAAAVNLGNLLAEQGDVEGARQAYQRATESKYSDAARQGLDELNLREG